MDCIPHFFPVCVPVCVSQISGPEHQDLTCENVSAVGGFSEGRKGHAILSLPTEATGSLHPGRKKHTVAGNTLEQSLLIYSRSHKGPTFPQRPEGQKGLADVRSVSWPQRKCIHLFIHFQKFKFESLVPM